MKTFIFFFISLGLLAQEAQAPKVKKLSMETQLNIKNNVLQIENHQLQISLLRELQAKIVQRACQDAEIPLDACFVDLQSGTIVKKETEKKEEVKKEK